MVSVPVMHHLMFRQRSAKHPLHDDAMFHHRTATHRHDAVRILDRLPCRGTPPRTDGRIGRSHMATLEHTGARAESPLAASTRNERPVAPFAPRLLIGDLGLTKASTRAVLRRSAAARQKCRAADLAPNLDLHTDARPLLFLRLPHRSMGTLVRTVLLVLRAVGLECLSTVGTRLLDHLTPPCPEYTASLSVCQSVVIYSGIF
jgi:hypothetical protein